MSGRREIPSDGSGWIRIHLDPDVYNEESLTNHLIIFFKSEPKELANLQGLGTDLKIFFFLLKDTINADPHHWKYGLLFQGYILCILIRLRRAVNGQKRSLTPFSIQFHLFNFFTSHSFLHKNTPDYLP